MNYAIQYHETSGDWLIFDIGEGFELVGMYSTEKDAKRNKNQLEKAFAKRAQWTIDPMYGQQNQLMSCPRNQVAILDRKSVIERSVGRAQHDQ